MANKQKNKGKRFERKVSKYLSGVFGLSFQRVPNSGAFTGGKNVTRYESLSDSQKLLNDGDLIMPDQLKKWSIECKDYAKSAFSWSALVEGKNSLLDIWIGQASSSPKPFWLIVFNLSHNGSFVCWEPIKTGIFPVEFTENFIIYKKFYAICKLESFFSSNKDRMLLM